MNIDEFFEDYAGGNHNTTSWTPLAIKEFATSFCKFKAEEALQELFPTKK